MLSGQVGHSLRQEESGLLLVPVLERPDGLRQLGFCQPEGPAVKSQGWAPGRHDGKRVSLSQV